MLNHQIGQPKAACRKYTNVRVYMKDFISSVMGSKAGISTERVPSKRSRDDIEYFVGGVAFHAVRMIKRRSDVSLP